MTTLEGQALARTIILALERMAFVLTEEVGEDLAMELGPYRHYATIGFTGQGQDVELFLAASDGFLLEFTANLLGLDENEVEVDEYGPQAITELATVVGGEVIVMMGGTEIDYSLGIPRKIEDEELDSILSTRERPLACYLESEGEILRIQILMTGERSS